MYALVTSDPSKVYIHPEGYIRTCSTVYNREDVGDDALASHLTNDGKKRQTLSASGSKYSC